MVGHACGPCNYVKAHRSLGLEVRGSLCGESSRVAPLPRLACVLLGFSVEVISYWAYFRSCIAARYRPFLLTARLML